MVLVVTAVQPAEEEFGSPSGEAQRYSGSKPQPNLAKRMEGMELAPAVNAPKSVRQRQQAGRTPCASRGSLPQKIAASAEEILLKMRDFQQLHCDECRE